MERERSTAADAQEPPSMRIDDLALPFSGVATRLARARVAAFVGDAGTSTLEVAELLTSELVANAVLHGTAPIQLHLVADDAVLRVEVDDRSRVLPAAQEDPPAVGGRGLAIVDALARGWGADLTSVGKTVWFELDL